jgi:hypothetical protein
LAKSRGSTRRARDSASTAELPASIATDVEKLRRYHAELGDLINRLDVDQSPADRVSRHLRRHLPLYALGTVWALMIILIPTVNERGTTTSASSLTESGTSEVVDGNRPTSGGTAGEAAIGQGAQRSVSGGPADTVKGTTPVAKVETGTGVTRGGYECKQGVRQIPWSLYAAQCVAKFTGSNGGATYRGVDDKTIRIAIRESAVSQGDAADAQNSAAGRATRAQAVALLNKYASWFGKTMELYGRKFEFVKFNSTVSNDIEEAQSRGKEGACADATDIAETTKAFAVLGYQSSFIETQPFAECAAERKMFVPFGASYFPEQWYSQRWHPYVWHVYMECEQISHDVAEYMGKRLLNRKAKWAKDPAYQQQNRVFGTYVPDNDGYQRCVNISEQDFKNKYGGKITHRYDYQLDVSRFPDQAAQAVVQFKAAGVTTLINACDTLSTRFLTEAADQQQWGPEWYIIGVALQDTDGQARTWNDNAVNGHLFGMSQLGQARLIEGKDGEAYKSWKTAFPNEEPPLGFGDAYYRILNLYSLFQAAGPVLTPQNIANAIQSMPPTGGAHGPFGTWSYAGDHTAIDDSREIYWDPNATGFDGNAGAYLETYGGKRFLSGQWPSEEPPIYPKKK